MDGSTDYHTKRSQSDKYKYTEIQNQLTVAKGKSGERKKLGIWD